MTTAPLREALATALPERPFRLELWDGSELPATGSVNGGPTFELRSPRALGHLLRAPGQLGLGRAYVAGDLDVDDVDAALQLLDSWNAPPLDGQAKARTAPVAVAPGRGPLRRPAAELHQRFERYALELSRRMTIRDVAVHLGVGWDLIKDIQKRDLSRRFAKPKLKHLRHIAIDEIAVAKGHRYLTVVLDLDSGAVVFVGDGKGADALKPFWKRLRPSGAKIEAVAMDMSAAYRGAVSTHLPEGEDRLRPLPRRSSCSTRSSPTCAGRCTARRPTCCRRRCSRGRGGCC